MPTSDIVIIYHGGSCRDGFCAAWVLRTMFKSQGRNVQTMPAQYGDDPPPRELIEHNQVFIVDFSYDRETLLELNMVATSLVVLDHHKSAAANLKGLDFCTFDMERSGARLAWDWLRSIVSPRDLDRVFGTNIASGHNLEPWLVRYVEDRDLWRHSLPMTNAVNASLRSYQLDFDVWDELATYSFHTHASRGVDILRYQDQVIDTHVRHAKRCSIAGSDVPIVNCTEPNIISEVVGRLAKGELFAAGYFDTDDGNRVYSLRSETGHGLDVSAIAGLFGGGGHQHAAGFTLPAPEVIQADPIPY